MSKVCTPALIDRSQKSWNKLGTSIGAFVGGLYAREGDLLSAVGRAKQFSGRMGNIWRTLSDVTYPIVAYTTVRNFQTAVYHNLFSCSPRVMSSTDPYTRYVRWNICCVRYCDIAHFLGIL